MHDKSSLNSITDFLVVTISGLGLSLDPPVFVACLLLSVAGAVIGRGFSVALRSRRAYGITLASGILMAITALLVNDVLAEAYDWWPKMPPQLIAIVSGLFGPIALPWALRRFPKFAERIVGKYLPEDRDA